jgi:hypothetical protein
MTHQENYNLSSNTIEEMTKNGLEAIPELVMYLIFPSNAGALFGQLRVWNGLIGESEDEPGLLKSFQTRITI